MINSVDIIQLFKKINLFSYIRRIHIKEGSSLYLFEAKLNNGITAYGTSYQSKKLAKIKCLWELMERLSVNINDRKSITYASIKYLQKRRKNILNHYIYAKQSKDKKLRWVTGYDAQQKKLILIPADLIYSAYCDKNNLSSIIALNGTAGGIDYTTALLYGIYELVERDAFMTIFYNKIMVPRVDLSHANKIILRIGKMLHKQKLELLLYNFTHDLQIPTFLSVIVDISGNSVYFSSGLKSNLNADKAMIGAVEEALTERMVKTNLINKRSSSTIHKYPPLTKKELLRRFYLYEQTTQSLSIHSRDFNSKKSLTFIIKKLKKEKMRLFYKDISLDLLKNKNCFIYKVIIPELQPYFYEKRDIFINKNRMDRVKFYFNNMNIKLN